MGKNMTTTLHGFSVEDITFKHARRQSEIENEIDTDKPMDNDVKAPVSLTPEQVKVFYLSKIAYSKDSNEKRVYSQTIKWIDELISVKKKLIAIEEKERILSEEVDTSIIGDIDKVMEQE